MEWESNDEPKEEVPDEFVEIMLKSFVAEMKVEDFTIQEVLVNEDDTPTSINPVSENRAGVTHEPCTSLKEALDTSDNSIEIIRDHMAQCNLTDQILKETYATEKEPPLKQTVTKLPNSLEQILLDLKKDKLQSNVILENPQYSKKLCEVIKDHQRKQKCPRQLRRKHNLSGKMTTASCVSKKEDLQDEASNLSLRPILNDYLVEKMRHEPFTVQKQELLTTNSEQNLIYMSKNDFQDNLASTSSQQISTDTFVEQVSKNPPTIDNFEFKKPVGRAPRSKPKLENQSGEKIYNLPFVTTLQELKLRLWQLAKERPKNFQHFGLARKSYHPLSRYRPKLNQHLYFERCSKCRKVHRSKSEPGKLKESEQE